MAITYDKQPSSYTQGPGVTTVFTPGASAQTTVFGSQTRQIRVANGGTIAWIKIDQNPTATATDSMLMPANTVDYHSVNPGQRCAVFGTGGSLSVTECS